MTDITILLSLFISPSSCTCPVYILDRSCDMFVVIGHIFIRVIYNYLHLQVIVVDKTGK